MKSSESPPFYPSILSSGPNKDRRSYKVVGINCRCDKSFFAGACKPGLYDSYSLPRTLLTRSGARTVALFNAQTTQTPRWSPRLPRLRCTVKIEQRHDYINIWMAQLPGPFWQVNPKTLTSKVTAWRALTTNAFESYLCLLNRLIFFSIKLHNLICCQQTSNAMSIFGISIISAKFPHEIATFTCPGRVLNLFPSSHLQHHIHSLLFLKELIIHLARHPSKFWLILI